MLTGIDLDTDANVDVAIERAARITASKIYIPEASGRLAYTIYNGVTDYLAPPSIFGGSFVDFRPQGVIRNPSDEVYRMQIEAFDETKTYTRNGVKLTFEFNSGTPIMRVASARTTPKVVLDPMSSITGWVAGGNASGLAVDTTVYYQQPGSLIFNLSAAGSQGYIEKTLTNPLNLTSYLNTGVQFLAVELPAAAIGHVTSIGVRLGNDSSNYYDVSNTTGQTGAFISGKFFLIPLSLVGLTPTGTVDITKIKYIRVYINYDGTALTNIRFGYIFISLPFQYELLFQSSAIFIPNVGAFAGIQQQHITNDNDQVALLDDAYIIFEHECAIAIAFQNGGTMASGNVSNLISALNGTRTRTGIVVTYGLYDLYRAAHPSEEIKTVGTYYDTNDQPSGPQGWY